MVKLLKFGGKKLAFFGYFTEVHRYIQSFPLVPWSHDVGHAAVTGDVSIPILRLDETCPIVMKLVIFK